MEECEGGTGEGWGKQLGKGKEERRGIMSREESCRRQEGGKEDGASLQV